MIRIRTKLFFSSAADLGKFVATTVMILCAGSAHARTPFWQQSPSAFLQDQQVCIALFSERTDTWLIHNLPQCQMPLSPCSTFKIPNALIGLEAGALTGADHTMTWDGTKHSREVLNQDHDLASAVKNSVVWYFQEVARAIGEQQMQIMLDSFDYGNRDISGGIDQFWLGSSLQISALNQVDFLRKLTRLELPVSTDAQEIVKLLLLQDYALPDGFEGTLYGKTGSCSMPGEDHGWFVGWLERDGDTLVFAVNIIGENKWGPDARRIAVEMLQKLGNP